jgi:hypothetical protein
VSRVPRAIDVGQIASHTREALLRGGSHPGVVQSAAYKSSESSESNEVTGKKESALHEGDSYASRSCPSPSYPMIAFPSVSYATEEEILQQLSCRISASL